MGLLGESIFTILKRKFAGKGKEVRLFWGKVIGGVGGLLLFCFLVSFARCPSSPPPASQPNENQKIERFDAVDSGMLKLAREQLNDPEIARVIRSISVNRYGATSVEFVFEMNPNTLQVSSDIHQLLVRNWCTAFATGYKNGQWVTVSAQVTGVKVSTAEYSPLTNRVVVK